MGDGLVRFSIEVFGEKQVDRTLTRFADKAGNARPLFASLAHDIEEIERAQFAGEGRRAHPWAWLQPGTVARKSEPRILFETGALEASLTGGRGRIRDIKRDELRFGTSVPYAGYHQSGTRHMPARPVIDFTEADKRAMIRKIQRFIVEDVVFP